MTVAAFKGWHSQKVLMPNGDEVVCYGICIDGGSPSLHDINHNVFRLDKHGNVIWQVQRDDSNMRPDWWDILHWHARLKGLGGAREPFRYLLMATPDGQLAQIDPVTRDAPDIQSWQPNCKFILNGSLSRIYELDLDTGIAKNVTNGLVRPW